MREATEGVARCQPFRVRDATDVHRSCSTHAGSAWVRREMCEQCNVLHAPRQPSRAATKCQSSTAENSPKRSWISRSDRSRKIQLVERRRSPFTKCTRPRTAPTSASGCISTNTSHRSSPRFSSPMCLARSWPGKVARSEEHTSELQSRLHLVCRLLLEKKKKQYLYSQTT